MSAAHLRTIEDLPALGGARVLVRCDFNVPLRDGEVGDDARIAAAVATLTQLLDAGAALVCCSHLGRPKGVDETLRLAPVGRRLEDLLGIPVRALTEVSGPGVAAAVAEAGAGTVVLLENLRFDPRETANDPGFAAELAGLADVYVDDAFGSAHRAHASVVGVAERLPAAAGRLMEREIAALTRVRDDPARPFVAILGGAKVSDKLGVVNALVERVDTLLVGGAMAFTFLAASGGEVGASLVEPDRFDDVRATMEAARAREVSLVLPTDVVAATRPAAGQDSMVVAAGEVPAGLMGLDVGPETVADFAERVAGAATVFWNGPMGVFEVDDFAAGTRGVAEAVAACPGYTVVGGGDSLAALAGLGLRDRVDHASTGGGASLEFVEGRQLPGVAVLMEER